MAGCDLVALNHSRFSIAIVGVTLHKTRQMPKHHAKDGKVQRHQVTAMQMSIARPRLFFDYCLACYLPLPTGEGHTEVCWLPLCG